MMGILDKLKFTKPAPAADQKPARPEAAPDSVSQPAEPPVQAKKPVMSLAGSAAAEAILVRPVLSEKGTHLAAKGKFIFEVSQRANKNEIRKSVQSVYGVHVTDVNVIKMPGKTRRYGKSKGRTSAFKKAVVSLRSGEKIPGIIESVG